ncbi:hypothetical protein MMC08_006129 [Hypocenomyce scalaris]|nr:hypothetical protein [Hypocenomyce scalaris]
MSIRYDLLPRLSPPSETASGEDVQHDDLETDEEIDDHEENDLVDNFINGEMEHEIDTELHEAQPQKPMHQTQEKRMTSHFQQ